MQRDSARSVWLRALAVWLAIMAGETVHGVLRQAFLAPVVGDLPARQIGVAIGSALIFAIAWWLVPWMGARTARAQLAVGAAWVALTVAFEVALGTWLGLSSDRLLADYDVRAGGYMAVGLLFMGLTPPLVARLRR